MNVQAFGRHNHLFLATAIVETSFRVDLAEVAGVQPVSLGGGHALAAHQDLAVGCNLHVLSFDNFSERHGPGIKRMIDGDHRTGFSQSVSLNDGEAEPFPEFLECAVDTRPAHDECPELPSEPSMHL